MASTKVPLPELVEPQTTAVVCVECQNGVIGPDSILPALAGDAQDLVAGLGRLLKVAREAGVLVVHATFEGTLGATDHGTAPLSRVTRPHSAAWGPGHRATQVLPELFDPEDLVLARHHGFNPAWGTELLPVLRGRQIRTLVLAGVSLNVALPLTAGEAMHGGFRVVVPRDAVAGTPAEYGEQMLRHTIAMLAKVVTVDDLASAWAKTAG
ncbi:cysteine hydrolase [Actinomadura madurae]|uniref:Nicotinamidase-related amidase n=1 Tax=Actinomadura madurae TaxID=1993 RepID=A0A1I5NLJ8_9ACTN|nr:cysteine hydrolase [Actinomadura madurae]SFP22685.1 Nicotinamidase-related amidase [Actinomadura madurae]